MDRTLLAAAVFSFASVFVLVAPASERPRSIHTAVAVMPSPAELLGAAEVGGFASIPVPYPFQFPRDHGSHPGYRTESWHLSGLLLPASGPPLALQLAIMRIALSEPPAETSSWDSGEIYAGMAAVSDPAGEGLLTGHRLGRGGIGIAGWEAQPMRLWLEDWSIERRGGADGALEIAIDVAGHALEIELHDQKPLVDHNRIIDSGGDARTPLAYYLHPRVAASGQLRGDGETHQLSGIVSIEHAWGELPLPGGALAQDRFSLYLADGRELFVLRSHRRDGSGTPVASALLIDSDASPKAVSAERIELRAVEFHGGGANYPLGWRLRIAEHDVDLLLQAEYREQEGVLWAPFWSGPVQIDDREGPGAGSGFMQLSGYRE